MRTISKNASETIRVEMSEFRGTHYLDVRTWANPVEGEAKPTHKGVTVPLASIPAFIEAVMHVGKEARPKAT